MAGIVWSTTENLSEITKFYKEVIGCSHWLSQPDVEILRHENLLLGFHQTNRTNEGGLFTFFYETKGEVDEMYEKMKLLDLVRTEVKENPEYNIYNFFAKDTEGRDIEFQVFLHDLPEWR